MNVQRHVPCQNERSVLHYSFCFSIVMTPVGMLLRCKLFPLKWSFSAVGNTPYCPVRTTLFLAPSKTRKRPGEARVGVVPAHPPHVCEAWRSVCRPSACWRHDGGTVPAYADSRGGRRPCDSQQLLPVAPTWEWSQAAKGRPDLSAPRTQRLCDHLGQKCPSGPGSSINKPEGWCLYFQNGSMRPAFCAVEIDVK